MLTESTFVDDNRIEEREEDEFTRQPMPKYKLILSNRIYQAVLVILLCAAVVVPLTYFFLIDYNDFEVDTSYTCLVSSTYRVTCLEDNSTSYQCDKIACCFDEKTKECYHTAPSKYGYKQSSGDSDVYTPRRTLSPLGTKSVPELKISVRSSTNRVQIVLHDASLPVPETRIESELYNVTKYNSSFSVEVFRDTGERILTTSNGPLIASEGYWEWTFQLTSHDLIGLGELILNKTETITKVIYKNQNDHNTVPAFMAHQNGLYHGLVVDHDGPLEVQVLPSKLVVLRSLVGQTITLNLAIGPTPKDVMLQQRLDDVFKIPPRWILGAHLCSETEISEDMAINNELTYDSDCLNENLMMTLMDDESKINETKTLISDLKMDKKFVIYLTPHVPVGNSTLYTLAEDLKVLYTDSFNRVFKGTYKNQEVAYLDFSASKIDEWFEQLFELIKSVDPDLGDAYALIDNWPAEETYQMGMTAELPYLNEDILSAMSYSIPWNLLSAKSERHYIKHNDYGKLHVSAVEKHTGVKPVMTSSYVYGMQNYAVVRNLDISWDNFKEALTRNLYHSFFMHPLISTPVCGSSFFNSTDIRQEEICIRWYLMATTMPLLIAPSDWPRDSDGNLGFAGLIAKRAMSNREKLSYYYYNFLWNGEPMARPMFYDFHTDNETISLNEQYMVGDSLLVAQPTYPASMVMVYLPPSADIWYEFWGGIAYTKLGYTHIKIVESDSLMFIRGGKIVPLKIKDDLNEDSFTLIIAMHCGDACLSEGSLHFENSALNLTVVDQILTVGNINNVQQDIDCANPVYPNEIKSAWIYNNGAVILSDNINLKLCDITDDQIDFNLTTTNTIK